MRSVLVSGDSLGNAWPPVNAVTDTKEDSSMKGNDWAEGGGRSSSIRELKLFGALEGHRGGGTKNGTFCESIFTTHQRTQVLVMFLSPTIYTIS